MTLLNIDFIGFKFIISDSVNELDNKPIILHPNHMELFFFTIESELESIVISSGTIGRMLLHN